MKILLPHPDLWPRTSVDLSTSWPYYRNMIKNEYNGWTNKQTWNINLQYREIFAYMAEERKYDDVDHMADSFESLVDELETDGLKSNTLAAYAVSEYLEQVNWVEIAEHYYEAPVEELI